MALDNETHSLADAATSLTIVTLTTPPTNDRKARQPHSPLTWLPNELFDQIGASLTPVDHMVLSITCKRLNQAFPLPNRPKPSLEDSTTRPRWYGQEEITLAVQLKAFMLPRVYAGNYGVFKFLNADQYSKARDAYWSLYPQRTFTLLPQERMALGDSAAEDLVRMAAASNERSQDSLSGKGDKEMTEDVIDTIRENIKAETKGEERRDT